jgi:putative ABC transport system ATP-binding protein
MSEGVLLEARGVGRRAPGGGWLLADVTLALRPGDSVALAGPSGAGKTLLLRALAFLDPLDAGEVRWRGRPVGRGEVPSFRREVVYLHQRPALFEGTVEDNLRLPFALKAHAGQRFDKGRALVLLDALGRDPSFLDKQQQDLSGGEAQVTALVRALQLDPTVLLLDEPTAALDPETARSAEALVKSWLDETPGRAFVWVGHDPAQALRVSARRVRLRAGRLEGEE